MKPIERVTVVGLGKLGSCIAAVLANRGVQVVGYDLDPEKVSAINAGRAPVAEPALGAAIVGALEKQNLIATVDAARAVRGTQAALFIVPTPSKSDGSFASSYLKNAIQQVARAVESADFLYIVCSTVMPGTCMEMSGLSLVYMPQFIALGSVIENLLHPDFVLLGESDAAAGDAAEQLWRKVTDSPISRMSLVEAEIAKISLNCFLTMKISFANQVSVFADRMNADAHKILRAIGQDRRIGERCLKPGLPYAGPCLPRDNRAFIHAAREARAYADLSHAADSINVAMLDYIYYAAAALIGPVGILGQSYKAHTPHTDESPGLGLANRLSGAGRTVLTHDPQAPHTHPLEEVLRCPIIIVATDWPEYRDLEIPDSTALIDPMKVIQRRKAEAPNVIHET